MKKNYNLNLLFLFWRPFNCFFLSRAKAKEEEKKKDEEVVGIRRQKFDFDLWDTGKNIFSIIITLKTAFVSRGVKGDCCKVIGKGMWGFSLLF